MIIIAESARLLKRLLAQTLVNDFARMMIMRMVLCLIMGRRRVSCSSAAGVIASQAVHRGQLIRFLTRPRWQIELFFKELKSTLSTVRYRFEQFAAVTAWMNCEIAMVLLLEHERVKGLAGCTGFRQECKGSELKYQSARPNTSGGLKKVQRLLTNAIPSKHRAKS